MDVIVITCLSPKQLAQVLEKISYDDLISLTHHEYFTIVCVYTKIRFEELEEIPKITLTRSSQDWR